MQAKTINIFNMPYDGLMQQGRPTKRTRTDFGQRVFEARQRLGVSQVEIAQQLGISQSAFAAWERSPVALKPEQLRTLADILNTSIEDLIGTDRSSRRYGGPTGKARRLFEQVSKLPRSQQQHVLTVVQAFVENKAVRS